MDHRGANGVIVITTKKGSAGKTRVDYDGQYGYSELPTNKLAADEHQQRNCSMSSMTVRFTDLIHLDGPQTEVDSLSQA